MYIYYSGRGPAIGPKKIKSEEEENDLTRDMEEPTPEPNIQEVPIPKPGLYSNIIIHFTILFYIYKITILPHVCNL